MKNTFILFFLSVIFLAGCDNTMGKVKGTLCYPSDYIPDMNVYLKNNSSGKIHKLAVKENQKTFLFKEVPEGHYVAYAYTIDETMTDTDYHTSKAGGGYTQFVKCGLTVECKDHTLIVFTVKKGEAAEGISICDWYGAIIPKEVIKTNP